VSNAHLGTIYVFGEASNETELSHRWRERAWRAMQLAEIQKVSAEFESH